MKKTLSYISIVLVLTLFGFTQTAAASERDTRKSHPAFEGRQSHEEHSAGRGPGEGFREAPEHREVYFRPAAHYERRLPAGYRTLRIANRILYYLSGIFYQSTPFGYEVVSAPPGVIVGTLPHGYSQILYGGRIYYVCNNTYYVQGPMGYSVVMSPSQGVMFPA